MYIAKIDLLQNEIFHFNIKRKKKEMVTCGARTRGMGPEAR